MWWAMWGLRRPRIFQERILLSLDASQFLAQRAAGRIGDVQQDAAELGQGEQTEPLAIIDRHHFQAGREQVAGVFPDAAIQFLALTQDQVSLHQSLGEQHEQRLIDHQGKGAGMHPGKVPEALVLPVASA